MAITSRRMTAEELLALPDDGMRHQLLAGELRTMAPNGRRHGRIGADLATALNQYVKAHRLGEVWGAETGCLLARNPDTLRAADVSFVRRARLGAQLDDQGYWPGAPDLVVEVLSPSDRRGEVAEKVATWLRHGAQMVVVVDARGGTVAVRRPNAPARTLTEADTLHGEDVIPGWSLAVREIFAVEPAG